MPKIYPNVVAAPESAEIGALGGIRISDTNTYNGDWFAVQVTEDALFATFTSQTMSVNGTTLPGALDSVVFPAGTILYGRFSVIALTVGAIIAYNAK